MAESPAAVAEAARYQHAGGRARRYAAARVRRCRRRMAAPRDAGQGVAAAVAQMGVVLAEHFPKGSENPNELPDRLIQL